MNNLSSLQLLAVFNLSMDVMLVSSGLTVLSLLIGDHLIIYFKLEERYPKLAKLIRLKTTLNKYYK